MPKKFKLGTYRKQKKEERPESLSISLPLTSFTAAPLQSIDSLARRLTQTGGVPHGWTQIILPNSLCFTKLDGNRTVPEMMFCVSIKEDMTWMLSSCGVAITSGRLINSLTSKLDSVSDAKSLLLRLDCCYICSGNADGKFQELLREPRFVKGSVTYETAYVESRLLNKPTIRHKDCERIVEQDTQCLACKGHRNSLHAIYSRIDKCKKGKENGTSISSHVNYRHLSSPEKDLRLSSLHQAARVAQRQISRLKARLQEETAAVGETVAEDMHASLQTIIADSEFMVQDRFPPDSFGRIFWEEQKNAVQASTPSTMRWHPLMIKWCLHLRHLSSSSYEALRKSGCLSLPSQRTLRDYTHFAKAESGFSTAVDEQLIEAAQISTCPEWKKCVVLLMDEMHIREDLVYDKFSGELVGFTDLGDINTHLADFQAHLENCTVPTKTMAKSVLVLMVRGLSSGLQFPYAQFPCASLRGDQMFHIIWKAVGRLQRYGFHVMGLTCDGLSANRQLFRLHGPKNSKEIVHKASNPYSLQFPSFYFLSDPPHLLKTIRNCFANKNRNLWFHHPISWSHIVDLCLASRANVQSLTVVPKLKYEHVYLTSFSKMRVDLAAQVLSGTVAHALRHKLKHAAKYKKPSLECTAKFVQLVDQMFDCLNVGNYTDGKLARNCFKQPYRASSDFRLKWLETEFLQYLEDWETAVANREGFSVAEKKSMLLSEETSRGLKLTVKSFIELAQALLSIPGSPPFLSRRITQDPLEKYFGLQRQRGRANENPSVKEFQKNSQALRVIQASVSSVRGNCRGNTDVDPTEHTPLRRRASKSKTQ